MPTDESNRYQPRSQPRFVVSGVIDVYDNTRDKYLGRVVNLHKNGLMVMGDQPFDEDCLYKLDLHLSEPVKGHNSIHIGVDCLWARNTEDNGKHWAGFTIIDASPPTLEIIEHLIEQLGDESD